MSAKVVQLQRLYRPTSAGWCPRELGEFYRVESVLIQAGLRVDTESGISDEGDPWFVFCKGDDGEVIVHIARIGHVYILASPSYEGITSGSDIGALVQDLVARHPLIQIREGKGGSNIFLHPAALLIAVVATAFFKSTEARALSDDDKSGENRSGGAAIRSDTVLAAEGHKTIAIGAVQSAVILSAIAALLQSDQPAQAENAPSIVSSSGLLDFSALLDSAAHAISTSAPINTHPSADALPGAPAHLGAIADALPLITLLWDLAKIPPLSTTLVDSSGGSTATANAAASASNAIEIMVTIGPRSPVEGILPAVETAKISYPGTHGVVKFHTFPHPDQLTTTLIKALEGATQHDLFSNSATTEDDQSPAVLLTALPGATHSAIEVQPAGTLTSASHLAQASASGGHPSANTSIADNTTTSASTSTADVHAQHTPDPSASNISGSGPPGTPPPPVSQTTATDDSLPLPHNAAEVSAIEVQPAGTAHTPFAITLIETLTSASQPGTPPPPLERPESPPGAEHAAEQAQVQILDTLPPPPLNEVTLNTAQPTSPPGAEHAAEQAQVQILDTLPPPPLNEVTLNTAQPTSPPGAEHAAEQAQVQILDTLPPPPLNEVTLNTAQPTSPPGAEHAAEQAQVHISDTLPPPPLNEVTLNTAQPTSPPGAEHAAEQAQVQILDTLPPPPLNEVTLNTAQPTSPPGAEHAAEQAQVQILDTLPPPPLNEVTLNTAQPTSPPGAEHAAEQAQVQILDTLPPPPLNEVTLNTAQPTSPPGAEHAAEQAQVHISDTLPPPPLNEVTLNTAQPTSPPGAEHAAEQAQVQILDTLPPPSVITGTKGNDTLVSTAGNVVITTKAGTDLVVFLGNNFGNDTITDFKPGTSRNHDTIQLDHTAFADFAAVQAHSAQIGSSTVITLNADNSVTLTGVSLASLHDFNFHFA